MSAGPGRLGLARVDRAVAAGVLAAIVIAIVVPSLVGSGWLATLTSCALYSIPAAGVGLLYGDLRLASLTQIAFVGLGGWVALRFGIGFGWPLPVLAVVSAAVAAAFGAVLALPALRLRDLYLALVTLLVAASADVAFNAAGFPNGGSGFLGYQAVGDLQRLGRPAIATTDEGFFRLTVVVLVAVVVALIALRRSAVGRSWALIAQSEGAAASCGIRITRGKVTAFAIASGISGLAGALIAANLGQLAPSTFHVSNSLLLFALVVIAGARSPLGWVLAALLYKAVPYFLSERGLDGNLATIVFGLAVMHNLIAAPAGLADQVGGAVAKLRQRRAVAA